MLTDVRRVVVLGSPGSGKSTLARKLGQITGLPVIHLDRHFWKPGWKPTPVSEWIDFLDHLVEDEQWILDGTYAFALGSRIEAADVVVYLDFGRFASLFSSLWRLVRWIGRSRPDMADGCPERLDMRFFRYVWSFPRRFGPLIESGLSAYGVGKQIVRLRSRREVNRWLASLESTGHGSGCDGHEGF